MLFDWSRLFGCIIFVALVGALSASWQHDDLWFIPIGLIASGVLYVLVVT